MDGSRRNGSGDTRGPGRAGQAAGTRQTIFAPATGPGVAGVAVIRISGPQADAALAALSPGPLPEPRRAVLRRLLEADGTVLDHALVLRFEEGASYTGEAVVELHCHGGPALLRRVMERLGEAVPCRLAEPGEFTRRALEAGRLDLAEVEALGDLLAAETEAQRRQAMRGVEGALHRRAGEWREALLQALALVEVTIDWADEDVPEDVGPEVEALVGRVREEIGRELSLSDAARRLRLGYEVALVGPPNSGKSSLLNYLAGREAALASPVPGTTRDVIELRYDLDGLPVVFLDMAGIRDTDDGIEALGVGRARERAEAAALRVFMRVPPADGGEFSALRRPGDIDVRAMCDLHRSGPGVPVSSRTGEGIGVLLERIGSVLRERRGETGLVGHLRQRAALEGAAACLGRARGCLAAEELAEEIRNALSALDRLIGRVGPEDVLDRVFARFCLGK